MFRTALLAAAFAPAFFMHGHAEAQTAAQAGTSAAVRGQVARVAADAAPVAARVQSGDAIYRFDRLDSGTQSGMQLMLLDETVFTIGADSAVVIDEFVYDPEQGAGKLTAEVTRGVFRFVTGKVASNRPSDMQVRLPVATIGVRGTMVIGSYDGSRGFVGLVGPGQERNTRDRTGEVEVWNAAGSVRLTRPGYGVFIDGPNVPPSAPFRIPAALYQQINDALTAGATFQDAVSTAPSRQAFDHSGQNTTVALNSLDAVESSRTLNEVSDETVIDALRSADDTGSLLNGQSTFEDLRSVASGQFHYFQGSVPLSDGGDYTIALDIDFGSRTVGGGNSSFGFSAPSLVSSGGFALPQQSFASGSGPAQFTFNGSAGGSGCMPSCNVTVDARPNNSSGVIAATLGHNVTVAGFTTVTGNGVAGRNAGLSGP